MEPSIQNKSLPYINSLSGLKAVCLLLVFCWHVPMRVVGNLNYGPKLIDFLFLTSGFLVGYNYFYKTMPCTWGQSFRFIGKKLAVFWPLHAMAMFAVMLTSRRPILEAENIINAVLNLLLLQAWSTKTRFTFNGASWFLSALIFCFFLTPFLLKLAKKIRSSVIVFVLAFVISVSLEEIAIHFPGEYWSIDIHTFPVVRALEYTMGMMLTSLFMRARDAWHGKKLFWIMTLLEVLCCAWIVVLMARFDSAMTKYAYSLPLCIVLLVFAFDAGAVSKLLACKPLKWFSTVQFEFYILHQAVLFSTAGLFVILFPNQTLLNLAGFLTTLVLAIGYKKFLGKPLSKLFIKAVNRLIALSQLDFTLS